MDDDGPGFFETFLLLAVAAGGGWFLWRTLSGQAQAAEALPGLAPAVPVDLSTAPAGPSSTSSTSSSTLGNPALPVGIRNNNPGNIKWTAANNWDGQTGQDSQGFCIFSDVTYGLRAMFILLASYQASLQAQGIPFTIAAISVRWTADNQTAWQNAVTSVSGIGATAPLDSSNQAQMAAVVNGIIAAENGAAYVGTYASLYPTAWSMAWG